MTETFDRALAGHNCWIRAADGTVHPVQAQRWLGATEAADRAFTAGCDGPTIDLGCGPGRLVAALLRRGIVALGIDISPVAVALTRARGAPVLRRDVLGPLPGAGSWAYALLADGNIGIGADPLRLLTRTRALLGVDGVAVVEFDEPGTGIVRRMQRVESERGAGPWFPWTRVGIEHAGRLAAGAGFRVHATAELDGRHMAWLGRAGGAVPS